MTSRVVQAQIVQTGDPVLRKRAQEVPRSDFGSKKLRDIIENMNSALDREADGVAIAAPQIGIPLRIFVVSRMAFIVENERKTKKRKNIDGAALATRNAATPEINMVFINPEIMKLSKKKVKVPEGCLSVRWFFGDTLRHEKALIRAYDENGKRFTYGGAGILAQIFQHETDHLNGVLFTDHATNIKELTPEEIAEIQSHSKRKHEE